MFNRLFCQFLVALTVTLALQMAQAADSSREDVDFDRLDGVGKSKKNVNVIEWEENLEIHVYPKNSLKGLALKIDRSKKDRPVMVIGYRFDNSPKTTIIRRAILSIPLEDGFQVFKDPDVPDYDKVIISNHKLANPMVAFRLDPEPTELYPAGPESKRELAEVKTSSYDQVNPAEPDAKKAFKPKAESQRKPQSAAEIEQNKAKPVDENGAIKSFSW